MSRGIQRERDVRRILADQGWLAFRAPASLGCADVVAMRRWVADADATTVPTSEVRLVEVKSTAQGPYEHFGPKDRMRLQAAAIQAGADAYLAWWPSRGKLRWIPSDEWPEARV